MATADNIQIIHGICKRKRMLGFVAFDQEIHPLVSIQIIK